jgi:hypothetical protein
LATAEATEEGAVSARKAAKRALREWEGEVSRKQQELRQAERKVEKLAV